MSLCPHALRLHRQRSGVWTQSRAYSLWKQHFTPVAKWCWPLQNRILANCVSLFKDNSWASSLVRQMMLLACWVPASLFWWVLDWWWLILPTALEKTRVTGFCFSHCNGVSCCRWISLHSDKWLSEISFLSLQHLPEVYSVRHVEEEEEASEREAG